MKKLPQIYKSAERIAKRLSLRVDHVSGFSDGTYQIELKELDKDIEVTGFCMTRNNPATPENITRTTSAHAGATSRRKEIPNG